MPESIELTQRITLARLFRKYVFTESQDYTLSVAQRASLIARAGDGVELLIDAPIGEVEDLMMSSGYLKSSSSFRGLTTWVFTRKAYQEGARLSR